MKTREEIINEIMKAHNGYYEKSHGGDNHKTLAEERGQPSVDKLLAEHNDYSLVITSELAKRLTEGQYLTCEDFDHFDTTCCDICHTFYSHYEMWTVVLSDGQHARVCDSIKGILMRETNKVTSSPETEEALRLLAEIFGAEDVDPIADELHASSMAAASDAERLYYCIKYAHHKGKRKRGYETVEKLVDRALRLRGRGPAQSARTA